MSKAKDNADDDAGITLEDINEDTLLPVRVKKSGQDCSVGNEEQALTKDRGFTKTVVYATAESILKCPAVQSRDQNVIANVLGDEYLDFESYDEELNSRYGRSALEIVAEDGVEAYEALGDDAPKNAYLHAALYDVTVWEAAQELDERPPVVIERDDEVETVGGGYGSPDLASAAAVYDGEVYERDLREFVPDVEWVTENWRAVGGNRRTATRINSTHSDLEKVAELAAKPEGVLVDSVINRGKRGTTIHHVKEIESSVVDGESDRLKAICGADFKFTGKRIRLMIDVGRIDTSGYSSFLCGNCENWADY